METFKRFVAYCKSDNTFEIKNMLEDMDIDSVISLKAKLQYRIESIENLNHIITYLAIVVAVLSLSISISNKEIISSCTVEIFMFLCVIGLIAFICAYGLVSKPIFCKACSYIESYMQQEYVVNKKKSEKKNKKV